MRPPRREPAIRAAGRGPAILDGWTIPVTVRAAADTPAGERRRFRMVAYTGEPLNLCGFDLPVVIDVATLDLTAQQLPALLDHMAYEGCIVGQIESVKVTGAGGQVPPVVAEGYFTPTADPRDAGAFVLAKADAGFRWQASVGGDPAHLDKIDAGKTVAVNGRTYAGPCYVARGTVLREISFVVLGADRRTSAVLARRRRIKGSAMDFETWVASLGFVVADLTDQQRAALQIQFNQLYPADPDEVEETGDVETPTNAEGDTTTPDDQTNPDATADGDTTTPEDDQPDPPPTNAAARRPRVQATGGRRPADPLQRQRDRAAAEEERQDAIRATAARNGVTHIQVPGDNGRPARVPFVAHAIRAGWSRDRAELEALRAGRGTGPAVITRTEDRGQRLAALQCAMVMRAGVALDHRAFVSPQAVRLIPGVLRQNVNAEARQRAMEAASRFASMSAVDLCREALQLDGREVPHDREEMIQAAIGSRPRVRAAGTSGGSLTNIFTTSVNAVLLTTYLEADDTTQGWVREQEVANFMLNERPRMTKGPNLVKLPRGGEADHATRSDVGESYKIARYSRQWFMDEQDFIDDNLGALTDTPQEFGLAAARLRPDLVYAILLANAALAATGRALANTTDGNKKTGAAFASGTVKAAIAAMRLVRENGTNLNLAPTHLIVPPTLENDAYQLVNSTENILAGTAGAVTERGNINTLQRYGLTVVSDSRTENGVTDPDSGVAYGGSSSTWWLVSNYAHTIEVGYRRGTGRAPRVRSWTQDREGKYGMGWDVNMDIGAKALDWKGVVRNEA